ncbi:hypothetical protein [Vibrio sp.]|uniref:hypothetical protein n=1 Tax=Vibrio sp. TaxID=678 RepID=UPI003D132217
MPTTAIFFLRERIDSSETIFFPLWNIGYKHNSVAKLINRGIAVIYSLLCRTAYYSTTEAITRPALGAFGQSSILILFIAGNRNNNETTTI